MNDWINLVNSEDIEKGDTLIVSDGDDEVFMNYKGAIDKTIILIDSSMTKRIFRQSDLEEEDGYAYIIGKAEENLTLKELSRGG